jgi:hypothetical protein
MDTAKLADESSSIRLGSMMRSLASTGTSYDMVEDDDYETTERLDNDVQDTSQNNRYATETTRLQHSSSPEPIVRTTSMGPPIPLRHPTPDLQCLQGAYIGNVERLEQRAERLSMTSDIGEEIRKLKLEQRRPERQSSAPIPATEFSPQSPVNRQFSSGSMTNSIIGVNTTARSGGYSPGGYVSSPKGSFRSGSWSQQSNRPRSGSKTARLTSLPEPEQEGRPLDSALVSNVPTIPPPNPSYPQSYPSNGPQQQPYLDPPFTPDAGYSPDERPSTAASTDTYRQATTLFTDFDGVHYTPRTHETLSRQVSLNRPPLASTPEHFEQPHPGESMVYYPAPVPMMLNLPQRLSKLPSAAERERRRTQLLNTVPADARKSAAWLSGVPELEENEHQTAKKGMTHGSSNFATVPPQLRASAFFDQPAARQEVEVKQSSAVATLDSILDASAHAPVSAFTDHPIVGQVGAEVYGKANPRKNALHEDKRKTRTSVNLLRSRENSGIPHARSRDDEAGDQPEVDAANASGKGTPLRQSQDVDRGDEMIQPEDEGQEESEDDEGDEPEEEDQYVGPPTTLLAELQLRKQQQKQRNRTAATAFPNGMHSTLLELDAVAQLQKQSRKQKHITLAWEDPEISVAQDDDDVPLGMLFPGKNSRDENRPLGLMEKREIEENEPLSRRRARLRGDVPTPRNPSPVKRASTMYTLEVPGLTDKDVDEEGETLAQRIRRLKAQGGTATGLGTDFTSEVMGQLGDSGDKSESKSKTPDAEETLGQRRKRLQAEAKSRDASGGNGDSVPMKVRHSMADILQAHPAAGARKPSNERIATLKEQPQPQPPPQFSASSRPLYQPDQSFTPGGMIYGGVPRYPSFGTTPYANGAGFNPMIYGQMGMNGYGTAAGYVDPMMGQGEISLDPKQRDMIDRWRQSVMQ